MYQTDNNADQEDEIRLPVDVEYLFPSPGSCLPILSFECAVNGQNLQTQVDLRERIDHKARQLDEQKVTYAKVETRETEGSDLSRKVREAILVHLVEIRWKEADLWQHAYIISCLGS